MRYPEYYGKSKTTSFQKGFGGLNMSPRISEGEFAWMNNMSSKSYPLLAPRASRGENIWDVEESDVLGCAQIYTPDEEAIAVVYSGVTGDSLRLYSVESGKGIAVRYLGSYFGKRKFVRMGARTVLFPDKISLGWSRGEFTMEPLENERTVSDSIPESFGKCGYYMTDITSVSDDGDDMLPIDLDTWDSSEPPQSPENGQLWLDRSVRGADPYGSNVGCVRCYSAVAGQWVDMYPTYVKMRYPGIGKGFKVGDIVTVTVPENAGPVRALEGTRTVEAAGEDYVVLCGVLEYSEVNVDILNPNHVGITLKRNVPDMDYITSAGNRLWGCRSGFEDGEYINEIYVSALGDASNWHRFNGTAADSYAVTVGEPGPFTGAATYMDTPIFFKERCAVKVLGGAPEDYETLTVKLDGVETGSDESIAYVDGLLFYKSVRGIMAYGGSTPILVSRDIRGEEYSHAAGGALDGKYYVSMKDRDGCCHVFVYDTSLGIWHREDDTCASSFCETDRKLFMYGDDFIVSVEGEGESAFEWCAETGMLGLDIPEGKYISKINIRAEIPDDAYLEAAVDYDSRGTFEHVRRFSDCGTVARLYSVIPRRCDHLRLRLSGCGKVKVYSLSYNTEASSG